VELPIKHFSASMLNMFYNNCQTRFKFVYVDKVKPKQSSNIAAIFGTTVHNVISKYYRRGRFDFPTLIGLFILEWQDQIKKEKISLSISEDETYREKGYKLLKNFYTTQKNDNQLIKNEKTEVPFFIPLGDFKIKGIVDCIIDDGIIDWKTGKLWKKDLIHTDRQMTIYSYMYEYLFKRKPKILCLFYLGYGKYYTERNKIHYKKIEKEMQQIIDFISKSSNKYTKNKKLCPYCEYKDICES